MLIHVLGVILASILFERAYSCSCGAEHEQSKFCSAEAVIKGKVLCEEYFRENAFVSRRVYELKLSGVYRDVSGNNLKEGQEIQVITTGDGSMCGIKLDIGDEYYLTAYKSGKTLNVEKCGVHTKALTQQQMNGIEDGKFDCTCKIRSRWHRLPRNETHMSCNLGKKPGEYDINCLMTEAFCRFDVNSQRCKWEADESKAICKRWSLPPLIKHEV